MTEVAPRIDQRVLCPTSGEICVAKAALLETYQKEHASDSERSVAFVPDDDDWNGEECYSRTDLSLSPDFDKAVLLTKLREYKRRAGKINCQGPVDADCPTRIALAEDETRTKVLRFVRKLPIFKRV